MDKDNDKKVILRFRFIVIFSVLLLLTVFVVYVIGTSIEDVYEREGTKTNTPVTTTTVYNETSTPVEQSDSDVTTTNDLAVPDEEI